MREKKKIIYRGYVQLKRQRFWVLRFVTLYQDRLTYSETETDIDVRGKFKLKDVEISEDTSKEKSIIVIKRKNNDEILKIETIDHKKLLHKLIDCQRKLLEGDLGAVMESSSSQSESLQKSSSNANEQSIVSRNENSIHKRDKVENKTEIVAQNLPQIKQLDFKDFNVDKNLITEQKPNEQQLKQIRQAQAAQETQLKSIAQFEERFKVMELLQKQGNTKINKMMILIQVIIYFFSENLKMKLLSLFFIFLINFSEYQSIYYLSILAFFIFFIVEESSKRSSDPEGKAIFQISSYLDFNINEFLKYLFIQSNNMSAQAQPNEASNSQQLLQKYYLVNTIYEKEQVIIYLSNQQQFDNLILFCSLSITDSEGFNISLICNGDEEDYLNIIQFLKQCLRNIKLMRNDCNSELFSYYQENKYTLFIGSNLQQKYNHQPMEIAFGELCNQKEFNSISDSKDQKQQIYESANKVPQNQIPNMKYIQKKGPIIDKKKIN